MKMGQILESQDRELSKVVLVGAGPGDVDLLTLKGREYIEQADCIIYDRLAAKDILNYAKPSCEFIFVGKENHHHVMKQDDINKLLVKKSEEYKLVVRLKGGDPYVFGRGGEEALYLIERGIDVEVLPGVTSVVSVLSSAGIPITHRGLAKGFQVISAHSKKDKPSDIDYNQLLDETVTLIFLMGLAHVREISKGLITAGRKSDTPAAVISKGTTVNQRKCVGTLMDIADRVDKARLESPAIIVVGDVVSLSDKLDFFEKRALFGKRINLPYIEGFRFSFAKGWIPFTENRLLTMLRDNGAIVNSIKVGKIRPIVNYDIRNYLHDSWLVFTSANGVNAFMYSLSENRLDLRALSQCKIATVGKKTAECLKDYGITTDFIPSKNTSKDLAVELLENLSADDRVVYFSAKEVEMDIKDVLGNVTYERVNIYENVEVDINVDDNMIDADYTCYTSASNVHRMIDAYGKNEGTAVSIGPSCSKALREEGITEFIQAKKPSYVGMIEMIIEAG